MVVSRSGLLPVVVFSLRRRDPTSGLPVRKICGNAARSKIFIAALQKSNKLQTSNADRKRKKYRKKPQKALFSLTFGSIWLSTNKVETFENVSPSAEKKIKLTFVAFRGIEQRIVSFLRIGNCPRDSVRLFSGQSRIRQNPLLMDCLAKEERQKSLKSSIKFSKLEKISSPPSWDFLGIREISAECWRREFQGKFSFVSSLDFKTFFWVMIAVEKTLKFCCQVGWAEKSRKSIWWGQLARITSTTRAKVKVIAEICNFSPSCQKLLASNLLITTITMLAKGLHRCVCSHLFQTF